MSKNLKYRRSLARSGSPFEDSIGFARACRIGPLISVSGTAPLDDSGKTQDHGNVYAQTRRCLELSIRAIEELGASAEDIIRTRIMLRDATEWEQAARAHGELFSDIKPACTFVEVSRFIDPDWLVETEVDAVISNDQQNV